MIFVYFFLPLLTFFYLTLRGLARLDLKIPLLTLSLVCTLITLFIYKELGGAVNFSLVIDQEILSRFIANESKNKENKRTIFESLLTNISYWTILVIFVWLGFKFS